MCLFAYPPLRLTGGRTILIQHLAVGRAHDDVLAAVVGRIHGIGGQAVAVGAKYGVHIVGGRQVVRQAQIAVVHTQFGAGGHTGRVEVIIHVHAAALLANIGHAATAGGGGRSLAGRLVLARITVFIQEFAARREDADAFFSAVVTGGERRAGQVVAGAVFKRSAGAVGVARIESHVAVAAAEAGAGRYGFAAAVELIAHIHLLALLADIRHSAAGSECRSSDAHSQSS